MNKKAAFTILTAAALLQGCSGAKETLGLEKSAPDEFAVVKRAPLSLPPDYTLRPPRPGAARPQEQQAFEEAKEALVGSQAAAKSQSSDLSDGESALLQRAGATDTDPSIRQRVDAEVLETGEDNRPVAQRWFGIGGSSDDADVVDPKEEIQRLRNQAKEPDEPEKSESEGIDSEEPISSGTNNVDSEELLYEGDAQEP